MITIKINKSEIKICESTASVAITKLDADSINEIVDLINNRNYVCKVIYNEDTPGVKLASRVGGLLTKKYDVLESFLRNFE